MIYSNFKCANAAKIQHYVLLPPTCFQKNIYKNRPA